jgi:hypothetical protein
MPIDIPMKIVLGKLRQIIRNILVETGGGTTLPKMPMIRNAMAPDFSSREQLGNIAKPKDPDELSSHLLEPVEDIEDCYGPVPPQGKNPYMMPDPYTKDTSPLPTSPIKR